MDKIKNIIGVGSNKEVQSTYDPESDSQTASNLGRLTGEGSHLGPATGNTGTTSGGMAETTPGPHSSDITNKADPRVDSNVSQSNTSSSDFATKAASTAWSSHNQSAPGAFPQDDTSNPYVASKIDPRVDAIPRAQDDSVGAAPTMSTTSTSLEQSAGAGLAQPTDAPSGLKEYRNTDTTGPSSGLNEQSVAGQAPDTSSALTGGTEDVNAAGSGVYDNTTSQSSIPPTSTAPDTAGTSNNQSLMERALGAIGLGGAAAKADEQTPSTTTGTDSYGTPAQSGGIPSHHRKESIPTTAYPSGTLDSPRAVAPPVGAPASNNAAAVVDEPGAGGDIGRATIGQTSTYGSHYLGSGEPTSSIVDPNSSDPTTYRKPETSHLGRDVGLGAGVGIAGIGAASAYDRSRDESGLQPGLQSGVPASSADGERTTFYDAATVGPQPGTTSSGLGGTATSQGHDTSSERHTGRDAAAVGVGAGALGAGAYEYEKYRGAENPTAGMSGYGSTTVNTTGSQQYPTAEDTTSASQGYGTTASDTRMSQGYGAPTGDQTTSQPYEQTADHHLGRDAAVAGAGVGAVGVGAHEYSKHDAKEPEKEAEKEQTAHDKALAQEEKQHEKKLQKSEKQYEKTMEKEERHREQEEAAGVGVVGAGAARAHDYDQHRDNLEAEHEKERKPSLIQRILHPRSSKASAHEEATLGLAAADADDSRAFHEHGDASSRTGIPDTSADHHHGIQGSGLIRESMTDEPGTGHQFGEITDHKR